MSVRDRAKQAEIDALAANPEPERPAYSGAGSAFMGRIGRPLENTAGMTRRQIAEQKVRGEFVEETDIRPAAEALAKAEAIHTENILQDKRALTEFLCQPKPLDEFWRSLGNAGDCPVLAAFERGYAKDASNAVANAFFAGEFKGFLNAESFRPYRGTAIEKEVLTILLDFMERNYLNSLSVSNWQKTLLLFISAHYALPWLQPKPAPLTAAERLTYTIGGRTYTGKAAIAAMPSTEFKKRLKEETGFASLIEEIETGNPLSTSRTVDESQPDPYTYNTTIILRDFEGKDLTQRMVDDLPSDKYKKAMKLIGQPVKSFEAVLDTDSYILQHLAARRQQWAR